jgi:hypothetical protein
MTLHHNVAYLAAVTNERQRTATAAQLVRMALPATHGHPGAAATGSAGSAMKLLVTLIHRAVHA